MTKIEKLAMEKEILKEIMDYIEECKEVHFVKKLRDKKSSFQFGAKKDYGNEFYIRFSGEEYEEVSENYVKEVIQLYCINKLRKIKEYKREGGILTIFYKAS